MKKMCLKLLVKTLELGVRTEMIMTEISPGRAYRFFLSAAGLL